MYYSDPFYLSKFKAWSMLTTQNAFKLFNTISVHRKLLLFVVLLMTLIITSISIVIYTLVINTFVESGKRHIVTLSESLTPKIGIWYFINKDSNHLTMEPFLHNIRVTSKLDYISFTDKNGTLIADTESPQYLKNSSYNIIYQQNIYTPDNSNNQEFLGVLKIVYSQQILEDLSHKFVIVGMMLSVLMALYFYLEMRLLSELLTPLKKIAARIKRYLPGDQLIFEPQYLQKKDVISEIANGFLHMQHNIDTAMQKEQIEEENNRMKDAILMKQARFIEMGMMINNIAHQWKQPLNIIELCITDLSIKNMMGVSDSEYQHKLFNDMHLQVEFMSKTLDIFKNFLDNNQHTKHCELFSIKKAIEDSIQLIHSALEKKHTEIDLFLDEASYGYGSISEIEQVLVILINNALDANSTKITIECKKTSNDNIIQIYDNGGGMPQEILENIFDAYFTTKHPSQGTGLGLFIAKMVIENKFNGRIEAFNYQNGALFSINLPLSNNTPKEHA